MTLRLQQFVVIIDDVDHKNSSTLNFIVDTTYSKKKKHTSVFLVLAVSYILLRLHSILTKKKLARTAKRRKKEMETDLKSENISQ